MVVEEMNYVYEHFLFRSINTYCDYLLQEIYAEKKTVKLTFEHLLM